MNPHHPPTNARTRFSDRVADYVRYRPGYPFEVAALLKECAGLRRGAGVADIGAGTGIFSRLLLDEGCEVFAVEPNSDMRSAAESLLGENPAFHPVAASGEETTLEDHSIDLIVSAQAFHWLDRDRARVEFSRILKPHGKIALIWNVRRTGSTPFLRDYEDLLLAFAPDYASVRHENVDHEALSGFFINGRFERHQFFNTQSFDLAGLSGRLLSSSYASAVGQPLHQPMMAELKRIFERHENRGRVSFDYDTEVFIGE